MEEILNDLPLNSQQLDTMMKSASSATVTPKTFHWQAKPSRPRSGKKRKANGFTASGQSQDPRAKSAKLPRQSIVTLADALTERPEEPSALDGVIVVPRAYTSQNGQSAASNLAAAFDHEALDRELQDLQNLEELAAEALQWLEGEPIDALPVPTEISPWSSNSQPMVFSNNYGFSESFDAEGSAIAALLDTEQKPPSLSQIFSSGESMTMGPVDPFIGPLGPLEPTREPSGTDMVPVAEARGGQRSAQMPSNGLPSFL